MTGSDSDSSDDWATEELVIPTKNATNSTGAVGEEGNADDNGGNDEDWAVKIDKPKPAAESTTTLEETTKSSEPMIIVDITQINENIHSKFDRNSVNDATGASALRKQIETQYEEYSKNTALVADRTVIPCGSSVWRQALVKLRDERPGHYFVPIFPPKR